MVSNPRKFIIFALLQVVPMLVAGACETPKIETVSGSTIRAVLRDVAWIPVQGAVSYHFRIRGHIPNGRVLVQHDAVVDERRFVPPQPLADHRAKVTVRLVAICGKETSTESVSWFTIDTAGPCTEGQAERRAYALTDGHLITAQESRTTPYIASTRPLCAGTQGEASYRVITPN